MAGNPHQRPEAGVLAFDKLAADQKASARYIAEAKPSWRVLPRQAVRFAALRALLSAGRSMLARMAMMAITTSNSIKVNFVFFVD